MADPLKARCQNNHKRIRTSRSHPPALQSLTGIDMKLGRDRLHENRRHLYCWTLLEHRGRINTMTMAVKKLCQQHSILIYEKDREFDNLNIMMLSCQVLEQRMLGQSPL